MCNILFFCWPNNNIWISTILKYYFCFFDSWERDISRYCGEYITEHTHSTSTVHYGQLNQNLVPNLNHDQFIDTTHILTQSLVPMRSTGPDKLCIYIEKGPKEVAAKMSHTHMHARTHSHTHTHTDLVWYSEGIGHLAPNKDLHKYFWTYLYALVNKKVP